MASASDEVKEEELEKATWRCLNALDNLLVRREILHETLRQGWMELVSARYEMGPARISYPLFSLKPQASKTVIDATLKLTDTDICAVSDEEGVEDFSAEGHMVFHLIKDRSERDRKAAADMKDSHLNFRKKNPSSQLRRRPVSILADDEKDELLEYRNLISDSDTEDDLRVQKSNLQGFGTIVSPHLRSAQSTFLKVLELAVELLNAQSEAGDAHSKVLSLSREH